MTTLTDSDRRAIARHQFEPLSKEWNARLSNYLDRFAEENNATDAFDDENQTQEQEFIITNGDLRSLIEEHEVDDENMRVSDPATLGPFDSVTETVVDTYIYLVCKYRNATTASQSKIGSLHGSGRAPELETRGTQEGKREGRNRDRSRSPEQSQTLGQMASNKYRSRSPEEGVRKGERGLTSDLLPTGPESTQIGESAAQYCSCRFLNCKSWQTICFGEQEHRSPGYGHGPQAGALKNKLGNMDCLGDNLRNLDYLFLPVFEKQHFFLLGIAPKQKFVFAIDSFILRHPDYEHKYDWDNEHVKPILDLLIQEFGDTAQDWPVYGQWASRTKTTDKSPDAAQQSDNYNCGVFTMTNALCLAFGYDLLCYTQEDLDAGKRPRIAAEILHGGFKHPFDYQLLNIPRIQIPTVIDKDGERFSDRTPAQEDTEMRDAGIDIVPRRRRITPILGHGEWPAQFDPQFWRKEGFLYAIREPMFDKLRYKYELKAACRKYNIRGYYHWEKRPVGIFRRWMENVMAGRRAVESEGLKPLVLNMERNRSAKARRHPTSSVGRRQRRGVPQSEG